MSRARIGYPVAADGDWTGLVGRIIASGPRLPRAACRGKSVLFDPDADEDQERRAKAICHRCPVLEACGQWADQQHALSDVWAGRRRIHRPGSRSGGNDDD